MKSLPAFPPLLVALVLNLPTLHGQVPIIQWETEASISAAEHGYLNLRMELDADGHPVILHGKSGSSGGLYCTRWTGSGFSDPVAVTDETGLFINDPEGPRMAMQGNKVAVGYQISGQWATGGRVVISEDGGTTWGDPISIAPEATEDHFMPVPAFDAEGHPWVAVKWGDAPALEGVLYWNPTTESFSPAVDAGAVFPGNAVCECCASMPFMREGQRYNLVRNNNANIRDFHLARTDGAGNWSESLDVDETDWNINSCPASEAEVALLGDGSVAMVYMSAAQGGARTYWSTVDADAWELTGTDRIAPDVDVTENNPSIDADGDFSVVAWERSDGGYQVMTAVGSNDAAGMAQWSSQAFSATEELSGHSRRPVIRIEGNTVHLVFQRPSDNVILYKQGTITTSSTASLATPDWSCTPCVGGWQITGTSAPFEWRLSDFTGRLVDAGTSQNGMIRSQQAGALILQVHTPEGQQTFKLVR